MTRLTATQIGDYWSCHVPITPTTARLKRLLSIGTFLALTTLTAPRRPCHSLHTHITSDLTDAPSSRGNSPQKRFPSGNISHAISNVRLKAWEWRSERRILACLGNVFTRWLTASVTLPQRHFCALFSPASVSNLPKTCWRLKPQVSLYFRMINFFPLWHTGSNFFLIKTILTVLFLAGECAGMETADFCSILVWFCEESWKNCVFKAHNLTFVTNGCHQPCSL